MAEVYAFLADGSEEVECLAVADVLVRAGIKVTLVSISNNLSLIHISEPTRH